MQSNTKRILWISQRTFTTSCNALGKRKWLPIITPQSSNKRTAILRKMVPRKKGFLQLCRKVPNPKGLRNKKSLRLKQRTTRKIIKFSVSATQWKCMKSFAKWPRSAQTGAHMPWKLLRRLERGTLMILSRAHMELSSLRTTEKEKRYTKGLALWMMKGLTGPKSLNWTWRRIELRLESTQAETQNLSSLPLSQAYFMTMETTTTWAAT